MEKSLLFQSVFKYIFSFGASKHELIEYIKNNIYTRINLENFTNQNLNLIYSKDTYKRYHDDHDDYYDNASLSNKKLTNLYSFGLCNHAFSILYINKLYFVIDPNKTYINKIDVNPDLKKININMRDAIYFFASLSNLDDYHRTFRNDPGQIDRYNKILHHLKIILNISIVDDHYYFSEIEFHIKNYLTYFDLFIKLFDIDPATYSFQLKYDINIDDNYFIKEIKNNMYSYKLIKQDAPTCAINSAFIEQFIYINSNDKIEIDDINKIIKLSSNIQYDKNIFYNLTHKFYTDCFLEFKKQFEQNDTSLFEKNIITNLFVYLYDIKYIQTYIHYNDINKEISNKISNKEIIDNIIQCKTQQKQIKSMSLDNNILNKNNDIYEKIIYDDFNDYVNSLNNENLLFINVIFLLKNKYISNNENINVLNVNKIYTTQDIKKNITNVLNMQKKINNKLHLIYFSIAILKLILSKQSKNLLTEIYEHNSGILNDRKKKYIDCYFHDEKIEHEYINFLLIFIFINDIIIYYDTDTETRSILSNPNFHLRYTHNINMDIYSKDTYDTNPDYDFNVCNSESILHNNDFDEIFESTSHTQYDPNETKFVRDQKIIIKSNLKLIGKILYMIDNISPYVLIFVNDFIDKIKTKNESSPFITLEFSTKTILKTQKLTIEKKNTYVNHYYSKKFHDYHINYFDKGTSNFNAFTTLLTKLNYDSDDKYEQNSIFLNNYIMNCNLYTFLNPDYVDCDGRDVLIENISFISIVNKKKDFNDLDLNLKHVELFNYNALITMILMLLKINIIYKSNDLKHHDNLMTINEQINNNNKFKNEYVKIFLNLLIEKNYSKIIHEYIVYVKTKKNNIDNIRLKKQYEKYYIGELNEQSNDYYFILLSDIELISYEKISMLSNDQLNEYILYDIYEFAIINIKSHEILELSKNNNLFEKIECEELEYKYKNDHDQITIDDEIYNIKPNDTTTNSIIKKCKQYVLIGNKDVNYIYLNLIKTKLTLDNEHKIYFKNKDFKYYELKNIFNKIALSLNANKLLHLFDIMYFENENSDKNMYLSYSDDLLILTNKNNNIISINNYNIINNDNDAGNHKIFLNTIMLENNDKNENNNNDKSKKYIFIPLYLQKNKFILSNNEIINFYNNTNIDINNQRIALSLINIKNKKYVYNILQKCKNFYFFEIIFEKNLIKFNNIEELYILLIYAIYTCNIYLIKYCCDVLFKIENLNNKITSTNLFSNINDMYLFNFKNVIINDMQKTESYDQANKCYNYIKYYDVFNSLITLNENITDIIKNFNEISFETREYQNIFLNKMIKDNQNQFIYFLPVGFGKTTTIIPLYCLHHESLKTSNILVISMPEHLLNSSYNNILKHCLIYKNNIKLLTYKTMNDKFNDKFNKNIFDTITKYSDESNDNKVIILLSHKNLSLTYMKNTKQIDDLNKSKKINILIDEIDDYLNPYKISLNIPNYDKFNVEYIQTLFHIFDDIFKTQIYDQIYDNEIQQNDYTKIKNKITKMKQTDIDNFNYNLTGGLFKKIYMSHCYEQTENEHIMSNILIRPYMGVQKPICNSYFNNIILSIMLTLNYIFVYTAKQMDDNYKIILYKHIKNFTHIDFYKYKQEFKSLGINTYEQLLDVQMNEFIKLDIHYKKNNVINNDTKNIYILLLDIMSNNIKISEKNDNISSIDIINNLKENIKGFTGTPFIHKIYNTENMEAHNKYKFNEVNFFYNIKYKLHDLEENYVLKIDDIGTLKEFLIHTNKTTINENQNHVDCIIDHKGLFKNYNCIEIGKILFEIYDDLKYFIYVDYDNKTKMLSKNNEFDYDYKKIYDNENANKYIFYFDNRNIIGTDIEKQIYNKKIAIRNAILILDDIPNYNTYQQAVGRCRHYLFVEYHIFISNKFKNLFTNFNELLRQNLQLFNIELYSDDDENMLLNFNKITSNIEEFNDIYKNVKDDNYYKYDAMDICCKKFVNNVKIILNDNENTYCENMYCDENNKYIKNNIDKIKQIFDQIQKLYNTNITNVNNLKKIKICFSNNCPTPKENNYIYIQFDIRNDFQKILFDSQQKKYDNKIVSFTYYNLLANERILIKNTYKLTNYINKNMNIYEFNKNKSKNAITGLLLYNITNYNVLYELLKKKTKKDILEIINEYYNVLFYNSLKMNNENAYYEINKIIEYIYNGSNDEKSFEMEKEKEKEKEKDISFNKENTPIVRIKNNYIEKNVAKIKKKCNFKNFLDSYDVLLQNKIFQFMNIDVYASDLLLRELYTSICIKKYNLYAHIQHNLNCKNKDNSNHYENLYNLLQSKLQHYKYEDTYIYIHMDENKKYFMTINNNDDIQHIRDEHKSYLNAFSKESLFDIIKIDKEYINIDFSEDIKNDYVKRIFENFTKSKNIYILMHDIDFFFNAYKANKSDLYENAYKIPGIGVKCWYYPSININPKEYFKSNPWIRGIGIYVCEKLLLISERILRNIIDNIKSKITKINNFYEFTNMKNIQIYNIEFNEITKSTQKKMFYIDYNDYITYKQKIDNNEKINLNYYYSNDIDNKYTTDQNNVKTFIIKPENMSDFLFYKKKLSNIDDEYNDNKIKIEKMKQSELFNNYFYFFIDNTNATSQYRVNLLSYNELTHYINKNAIYNKECDKINTINEQINVSNILNKLLILFNMQMYNEINNNDNINMEKVYEIILRLTLNKKIHKRNNEIIKIYNKYVNMNMNILSFINNLKKYK
jgi:hypothetical protein